MIYNHLIGNMYHLVIIYHLPPFRGTRNNYWKSLSIMCSMKPQVMPSGPNPDITLREVCYHECLEWLETFWKAGVLPGVLEGGWGCMVSEVLTTRSGVPINRWVTVQADWMIFAQMFRRFVCSPKASSGVFPFGESFCCCKVLSTFS